MVTSSTRQLNRKVSRIGSRSPVGNLIPVPEAPFEQIVLIVNSRSRSGSAMYQAVLDECTERGVKLDRSVGCRSIDELKATLAEYADTNTLCLVGGGDGTLNLAANCLAHKTATLGVVPLGTGNSLARDLGIPAKIPEAIQIALEGKTEAIDLGQIGEQFFVNVATVGLTTDIAAELTVPMKRRFGKLVYGIAVSRALKKLTPFRLKLTLDGQPPKELEAIQLVIGNGRYHAGPFLLSFTSAITSGRLTVYAVEPAAKKEFLKMLPLLPVGLHGALKHVHSFEARAGTIETDPAEKVIIDGELGGTTPITFSIAPGALRVRVPDKFKG